MAAPFTPQPPGPEDGTGEQPQEPARPAPPPGITTREHMTLEDVARAAADVIAAARADGLTPPYGIHANDYGTPRCTLYLSATDTDDIWGALDQWARRYGTIIDTRTGSNPGTVHAEAGFIEGGVRFEVSTVINPDDGPPATSQAA
jgi:hypothetical protein